MVTIKPRVPQPLSHGWNVTGSQMAGGADERLSGTAAHSAGASSGRLPGTRGGRSADAAGARQPSRRQDVVEGKPSHDFGQCIACAACAAACEGGAIRIFIDEDEGFLVWTLDLFDCTSCGKCASACPTGAMSIIPHAEFADDPEPPKRCLFALRECESCGRYYATNKEIEFANALLAEQDHADAAHARALTTVCPDCKRIHDAKAAARRSRC